MGYVQVQGRKDRRRTKEDDDPWRELATAVVLCLGIIGTVTSDDLRDRVATPETGAYNKFGAVFTTLQTGGFIRKVGETKSTMEQSHGSGRKVWQTTLAGKGKLRSMIEAGLTMDDLNADLLVEARKVLNRRLVRIGGSDGN
jgi:hypothetical protein